MIHFKYKVLSPKYLAIFSFSVFVILAIFFSSKAKNSRVKSDIRISPCKDCNVVFVSFDTLRVSNVHAYGYGKNTTPAIDAMAVKGFLFENAISVSSWTLPASMSWFTGVYPSRHKVINKYTLSGNGKEIISDLRILSPEIKTLAEVLSENGYKTGGFTGGSGVSRIFGFDMGFDIYLDDKDFAGFEYSYPIALEWIEKNRNEKFFVFLHGYDIHGQYVPEGGYDKRFVDFEYKGRLTGSKEEQKNLREEGLARGSLFLSDDDVRFLRALYDEKIQRADENFSKFLDRYNKLGLMGKTIFILTSDHGEEFYEHGQIDHGHSLYEELIHIPLIITLPQKNSKISVSGQISSIDIYPTVLDILSIKMEGNIRNQLQGTSLVPLMEGKTTDLAAFSETDYRYAVFKRSLKDSSGWKIIKDLESGIPELYNLSNDKLEQKNLAVKEQNIYTDLNIRLQTIIDELKK